MPTVSSYVMKGPAVHASRLHDGHLHDDTYAHLCHTVVHLIFVRALTRYRPNTHSPHPSFRHSPPQLHSREDGAEGQDICRCSSVATPARILGIAIRIPILLRRISLATASQNPLFKSLNMRVLIGLANVLKTT